MKQGLLAVLLSVSMLVCPFLMRAATAAGVGAVGSDAGNVRLIDVPLLDQDGKRRMLVSDLVGEKIVVMNFIFTTCPSVCPMQSAIFAGLQKELGDRLGSEVKLLSLSIDPVTDVPARLAETAARYGAREGWTWLTGEKADVDRALIGLGAYSSEVESHPAMILVGDGSRGGWTRFYGFPRPADVLARVDALAAARIAGPGAVAAEPTEENQR
ncbi:MAG: SCO family protein [Deltaproteobacteria bacterium]|nr:SCO family protein [Deltaproteobacteria bacterium]